MNGTDCDERLRRTACSGGCRHCATTDRGQDAGHATGPLSGRSFALASAGHFLVPVFLACIGAVLGESHGEQFIGAVAGLGAGMLLSTLVARRRRANEETVWQRH